MGRKKIVDEIDEDIDEDIDEILEDDPEEMEIEIASPTRYVGLAGFAIGLAVGALLGAGAAMLSTPVRGETLRRRIRRTVENLSDEASDRVDRIRDDAGRHVERTRRRISRTRKRRR